MSTLVCLVRAFSVLPARWSGRFARSLRAAARHFHVVNYLGSLGGGRVLGHSRMEGLMDNVTNSLTGTTDGN